MVESGEIKNQTIRLLRHLGCCYGFTECSLHSKNCSSWGPEYYGPGGKRGGGQWQRENTTVSTQCWSKLATTLWITAIGALVSHGSKDPLIGWPACCPMGTPPIPPAEWNGIICQIFGSHMGASHCLWSWKTAPEPGTPLMSPPKTS